MTAVVVVGAGLTGLIVGYRLAKAATDLEIHLIEAQGRTGGQIHTFHGGVDLPEGLVVELGAEGFVARSEHVPPLCRDLGIEDQLIEQTTTLTYALEDGGLRALEDGEAAKILGFQVPKKELGRGIRSMAQGMGQLPDALEAALADVATWHRGARVEALDASASGLVARVGERRLEAAAAVITVATPAALPLIGPLLDDGGAALAAGRRLSNVSVTLLYRRADVRHPLEASGFILPGAARATGFRACSFASHKFARGLDARWVTLRAFFRPTDDDLASTDDEGWAQAAHAAIAGPLGIGAPPTRTWVSTWPHALPVYDDDYRAAVAAAAAATEPLGVFLAGSHYDGAGIDAAVASAERTARSLLARLR